MVPCLRFRRLRLERGLNSRPLDRQASAKLTGLPGLRMSFLRKDFMSAERNSFNSFFEMYNKFTVVVSVGNYESLKAYRLLYVMICLKTYEWCTFNHRKEFQPLISLAYCIITYVHVMSHETRSCPKGLCVSAKTRVDINIDVLFLATILFVWIF